MLYHPPSLYMHDAWYYTIGKEVHCIHMQARRPNSGLPEIMDSSLGHEVSEDLIRWRRIGDVLAPNPVAGSCDDTSNWTGCVEKHDGKYYLFYTARSTVEQGAVNRGAVAISEDGYHFERCEENPILIPDSQWYANEWNPLPMFHHGEYIVDCRDMCVVKAPDAENLWYGYYMARIKSRINAETSVIGVATSRDLIHWEQHGPCFVPNRYACVEVPEVFRIGGKWYMLCLTGNAYGQRGRTSDPDFRFGTIYATADHPMGPFVLQNEDNVLLCSRNPEGYSAKTLEIDGKRVLFYIQGEYKKGCHMGCLSLPSLLDVNEQGWLRPWYHPAIDSMLEEAESLGRPLDPTEGKWGTIADWREEDGVILGVCQQDWAILPFEKPVGNGCLEATVTCHDGRSAGLCFRLEGEDLAKGGLCVLLDHNDQKVILTGVRSFPDHQMRSYPLAHGISYRVRLILTGDFIYVYLNDELVLQCCEPSAPIGKVALFIEEGSASFAHLILRRECDGVNEEDKTDDK